MQKCSICEKPIYGRSIPKTGSIVCGSCPLKRAPGAKSGKSFFEVRMDMAKLVTKQISREPENLMRDLKVKSNVGNRTILLDGRYPVKFDAQGYGTCPAHLRELLEREMIMRPGRFSIIEERAVLPVVEAPPVVPVPEKVAEVVEAQEQVPPAVDQSFLVAEETVKPAKASKKK